MNISVPNLPCSTIPSQVIWYNKYIRKENKSIHYFKISEKKCTSFRTLFKIYGKQKLWAELKNEFHLHYPAQFAYNQKMHAIPKSGKDSLVRSSENINNLVSQHHLTRRH